MKDKNLALINECKSNEVGKKADKYFVDAMNESFEFHYKNNEIFRKNADKFSVKYLKSVRQLADYPYIFVNFFKEFSVSSVPDSKVKIRLSSSGTGGKKSYHPLDDKSLERIKKIVTESFSDAGLVSNEKHNYLCFTYDPNVAKDVGTAFSDKLLTNLTPIENEYYALKYNKKNKEFEFNEEECVEVLNQYEKSGLPLRILGFPAYIWKVLSSTKKYYKFPKNSAIITGGGWKLHTGVEVEKSIFKSMIGEKLGISPENIRDTYGMVEHGIPYLDCKYNHFHIPVYSRILIRDPLSLDVLDNGKTGIMHLFTPYMHSFPAISLLTTDKAYIKSDCPCGRKTPYFVLQGRGGLKKHKGCAINAAELLSRIEKGKK
jgi:phenylacetate-coenzyme A ligase PaaK-like adenylate-forming protein